LRSISVTNFVDSNKKQFKLNLGKSSDGNYNKDIGLLSGNLINSPNRSFKKSPKILIVNDDNDSNIKDINENSNITEDKNNQEKTKSPQNNLDLNKNKSVSQFYN
jgi:hypothetical protein